MLTETIQKLTRQGYSVNFDYSPLPFHDGMTITISKGRYRVRQFVPNEHLYQVKAAADEIVTEIIIDMVRRFEKELC